MHRSSPGGRRGTDAPAEDPIGGLAQRRITDSSGDDDPMRALRARCASYAPGDTDLAWTRATTWRTILAASLDQPYDPISSVKVSSEDGTSTGEPLAAWLGSRLDVPSSVQSSPGPGITEVELAMNGSSILPTRPDGRLATLSRPDQPDRTVALPRRSLPELLTEELRRLDPDEVYAETLHAVSAGGRPYECFDGHRPPRRGDAGAGGRRQTHHPACGWSGGGRFAHVVLTGGGMGNARSPRWPPLRRVRP